MINIFKGSGVALVTPFLSNGQIDFMSLRKLVDYQVSHGTHFLVVQGTTGESPTLTQSEKQEALNVVLEANNGRCKVVFGTGGNNTMAIAEAMTKLPKGIDGILSVSPYYNKPTQAGIIAHYKHIAQCTDLPIILYNVPGRTGSNVFAETTLELAECDNIVAMKEASGNLEQIMQIIKNRPQGFGVLSGDDNLTLPLIAAGADGVISVVANAFPKLFSEMVNSALAGDFVTSRSKHYDLFEVTKMFFEQGNPGGVKVALEQLGIMSENMRLPLVAVSQELKARIQTETARLEKL